jgi:hypothetical protein
MTRDDALLLLSWHEVHLEDVKTRAVVPFDEVRWHRRRKEFWQTVINLDDALDLDAAGDWATFAPSVDAREKRVLTRLSA